MAAAQQQQQFFARAQPLCSTVLRAVPSQDLGTATEAVRSLQQQIAEAPAALFAFAGPREGDAEGHPAIEGASGSPGDTAPDFLDVLMLPLLLVLDAHYPLDGDTSAALAKRGASQLCEASLECLEELLGKSTVTGPQFLRLLRTLGRVAARPRTAVSEEECAGALRCLRACLQNKADDKPEHPRGLSAASSNKAEQEQGQGTELPLRQFLHRSEAAPSLGYLLSLCLQVAEAEATAAHLGSKALFALALATLRASIETVRDADALAFFVPGVSSGLVRHVLQSLGVSMAAAQQELEQEKLRMPQAAAMSSNLPTAGHQDYGSSTGNSFSSGAKSGAVRSSNAGSEALAALKLIMMVVFRDALYETTANAQSIGEGMNARQQLSAMLRKVNENTASSPAIVLGDNEDACPMASPSSVDIASDAQFRVERSPEWLRRCGEQLCHLLATMLPHARHAANPRVRMATAQLATTLLLQCSKSLPLASRHALDTLFALAADNVSEVRAECSILLEQLSATNDGTDGEHVSSLPVPGTPLLASSARKRLTHSAQQMLARRIALLPRVLASYSLEWGRQLVEVNATAGCMSLLGPATVYSLFTSAAFTRKFFGSMQRCLRFDAAQVLLACPHARSSCFSHESSGVAQLSGLARMPLGLAYITNSEVFRALSLVCRLGGAALAHRSSQEDDLLESHLQHLLGILKSCLPNHDDAAQTSAEGKTLAGATSLAILTEIMTGAIHGWRCTVHPLEDNLVSELRPTEQRGSISTAVLRATRMLVHEFLLPELWDVQAEDAGLSNGMHEGTTDLVMQLEVQKTLGHQTGNTVVRTLIKQQLVEAIGCFALALGSAFDEHAKLVNVVLCPLLEALGEHDNVRACSPSNSSQDTVNGLPGHSANGKQSTLENACTMYTYNGVSESASVALTKTGLACGLAPNDGIARLIDLNADYIIDYICRQLRSITISSTYTVFNASQGDSRRRLPQLFLGLLLQRRSRTDVQGHPEQISWLLPLLVEPLQVIARKLHLLSRMAAHIGAQEGIAFSSVRRHGSTTPVGELLEVLHRLVLTAKLTIDEHQLLFCSMTTVDSTDSHVPHRLLSSAESAVEAALVAITPLLLEGTSERKAAMNQVKVQATALQVLMDGIAVLRILGDWKADCARSHADERLHTAGGPSNTTQEDRSVTEVLLATWPIVTRIVAEGSNSGILALAFEVLVTILAADHLGLFSSRFAKELWPAIMRRLQGHKPSLALASGNHSHDQLRHGSVERGKDYYKISMLLAEPHRSKSRARADRDETAMGSVHRVQIAALRCVTKICHLQRTKRDHVFRDISYPLADVIVKILCEACGLSLSSSSSPPPLTAKTTTSSSARSLADLENEAMTALQAIGVNVNSDHVFLALITKLDTRRSHPYGPLPVWHPLGQLALSATSLSVDAGPLPDNVVGSGELQLPSFASIMPSAKAEPNQDIGERATHLLYSQLLRNMRVSEALPSQAIA